MQYTQLLIKVFLFSCANLNVKSGFKVCTVVAKPELVKGMKNSKKSPVNILLDMSIMPRFFYIISFRENNATCKILHVS